MLTPPDVMKIGGASGWLRAAALAHANGIPMSNHLWPELSARLLCCTSTAHWLEYADWWNPVLAEPLHVDHGMSVVTEGSVRVLNGRKTPWSALPPGVFLWQMSAVQIGLQRSTK